jgi:hypothetical protein
LLTETGAEMARTQSKVSFFTSTSPKFCTLAPLINFDKNQKTNPISTLNALINYLSTQEEKLAVSNLFVFI